MTTTISSLYDNYTDARAAVNALEAAGVPHSDISIVANNSDGSHGATLTNHDGKHIDPANNAGTGAGIGAGLGGAAGLLAGLGLLAIPGLGPVVAAGWLAATAVGAVAGAATGGLVGGLTEAGVSKEDAGRYAEGVRRGGTLVTAKVAEADKARFDAILHNSSVNIHDRSAAWQKSGWQGYDPDSHPLDADGIRKERDLYR